MAISGVPFQFLDTAGLREDSDDTIEIMGMARARAALDQADLVLWLGPEGGAPDASGAVWEIAAQADREDALVKAHPRHRVSALTGQGVNALRAELVAAAREAMPIPGEVALNARQARLISDAADALDGAGAEADPLLLAERLRLARTAFDSLLGRATTEDMLDTLFGRFCIGK